MDYKLAKQLKGSGYKGEFDLSSLIDACGDKFRNLTFNNGKWYAFGFKGGELDYVQTTGQTSEIAVAKLYLEFKKGNGKEIT